MLFLPAVQEAKKRLGELGQITMVDLSHSFSATYNGWVFDKEAGGGPLMTSGIYAMELLSWLFGKITCIGGIADKLDNGVEWQYILTGKTETGVSFSVKNSTRSILENTCRIYGEKGYIELPNYWKARKVIFHIGGETQLQEYPCEHELVYEAMHIADCIEKGLKTSPVITEALSLAGICAIEKVKENW